MALDRPRRAMDGHGNTERTGGGTMRRRELIGFAGAAFLAWPRAARAQSQPKVARIGVLRARETLTPDRIDALQKGLREFGYVGVIEERYADGKLERLPRLAAELVTLQVDVILATDNPAAHAAKKITPTIPVVFVGPGDPVGSGLVPNLARPGGNITGISAAIDVSFAGKWLELVKEMLPRASRIGFIWSPANSASVARFRGLERAAPTLGLKLQSLEAKNPADHENAFKTLQAGRADALIVDPDPVSLTNRKLITHLAARARVPTVYGMREFVDVGGLISYGPNLNVLYVRAGRHVAKILQGTKPADLPVEQPTTFELIVNLKTAKALDLTVPPSVLLRADQVIE